MDKTLGWGETNGPKRPEFHAVMPAACGCERIVAKQELVGRRHP